MLIRMMSILNTILIAIWVFGLPKAEAMSGYGYGPMAGAGAYGAFQGCPYPYYESEEMSHINDEIDELKKDRKKIRGDLREAKKELKDLQGSNRRGGQKGEALKELKKHLRRFAVNQIKNHVSDIGSDRCSYEDACSDEDKQVKPRCLPDPACTDTPSFSGLLIPDGDGDDDENMCHYAPGQLGVHPHFCVDPDGDASTETSVDLWDKVVGGEGEVDDKICLYKDAVKRIGNDNFDRSFCQSALADYIQYSKEAREKAGEVAQLERDLKDKEKELKLARSDRERIRDEGEYDDDTEAGCPSGNCYRVRRPKVSKGRVIGGVIAALAGAYLGYRGAKHMSSVNSRMGWPSSPHLGLAGGMMAAQGLYGAVAGGMRGGGYGCAGHMGAGGFYGSGGLMGGGLYGPFMGGAFGYPPGMFGPFAGGGMYMPGMGPWGVAGPGGAYPFGYPGMMIGGAIGLAGGGGMAFPGFPGGGFGALAGGGFGALAGGGFGALAGGGFGPIPGFALAGGGFGALAGGGFGPIPGFALAGGGFGALAGGGFGPIPGFALAGGGFGALAGGGFGALAGGGFGALAGGGALGTGYLEAQQRMLAQYQAQIQAQTERQAVISRLYGELQRIQTQIQQISGGGGFGFATPLPNLGGGRGDPNLGPRRGSAISRGR